MSTPTPSLRSAGILLHPSSLPGRFGIGDLGPAAYAWVEGLARANQTWWQVLPLGPTGFGDSPYQCFSAFAGNPMLVSPELLVREGLLSGDDLAGVHYTPGKVDYGTALAFKDRLFGHVWGNFRAGAAPGLRQPFEQFCLEERAWLDDFALFMALKQTRGHWQSWPEPVLLHRAEALTQAYEENRELVGQYRFRQFLFFRQWRALKEYANGLGIKLIGDIPIFVSLDSADVWSHPDLFLLDEHRRPTTVAGVPPDYFSATGQLWGNPHYDWEELKKSGYAWWVARVRQSLALVDLLRLDHFLGFSAAWHIPGGQKTAQVGEWVAGPGADLLSTLYESMHGLPLIAEDLGLVTPEVEALRDQFHLPGMKILHFAFGGGAENRFLPHHYTHNYVAYTGTHDNDTTTGWYRGLGERERDHVRRYLGRDGRDIAWDLIRLVWSSVADWAIAPAQDLLSLGSEARMNMPGRSEGNWMWRLREGQISEETLERLADLTNLYGR